MPRELIWVTCPRQKLCGDRLIGPEYPRDYTPDQMRQWAADLQSGDPRTRSILMNPGEGLRGDLRADGLVELAGGRHRAAYMMEQGVDPIPVWVSCPDEKQLRDFQQACRNEQSRADRAAASRTATAPVQQALPARIRQNPAIYDRQVQAPHEGVIWSRAREEPEPDRDGR